MLNKKLFNIVFVTAILIGSIWFLSDIALFFILSLIIAAILSVPTNYLSQTYIMGYRIPRAVSILFSFSILAGVLALFILLFIPLVSEQLQLIADLDYNDWIARMSEPLGLVENFLIGHGFVNEMPGFMSDKLRFSSNFFIDNLEFANLLNQLLAITGTFFIGFIAVIFITFFLLFEKGILRRKLISLIPNSYFEVTISALYKVEKLLSNYLLGLSVQMFSIFTLASIGLLINGVNYALTIAVFSAIANLIPYVGPILGAAFGVFVGLTTAMDLQTTEQFFWLFVKIGSVYGFIQLIDNILLQPVIFSKSVKAHPLEIFVVVFVGAKIAGPVGMIMAIPGYTIIRVCALEFYKGYKEYKIFRS